MQISADKVIIQRCCFLNTLHTDDTAFTGTSSSKKIAPVILRIAVKTGFVLALPKWDYWIPRLPKVIPKSRVYISPPQHLVFFFLH